jgi:hypothetical protein
MYVVALYTDIVSGILSPQSKIPSYDVFCKEVCWELSSAQQAFIQTSVNKYFVHYII